MNRAEKHAFVKEFRDVVSKNPLFVVTRQSGLTAADVTELRRKMRGEGGHFRVAKNTLLSLSFKETAAESLVPLFEGPTGIAYSEDPIAAAKAVVSFSKDNDKLQVMGGCLNGSYMDAAAVKALASLPSLEVLRGQILGVITAPLQKLMGMASAPASSLVRVIMARSQKES